MKQRSREINIFSISALDLFASALGAFILMSLVFMVFFTMTAKTPTADAEATPTPPAPQCPDVPVTEPVECPAPAPVPEPSPAAAEALAAAQANLAACEDALAGTQSDLGALAATARQLNSKWPALRKHWQKRVSHRWTS